MGNVINIGGRFHSTEVGNVVSGANEILDDTKGKKQNVINAETDAELLRLENDKQDNLTFDNTPTEDSVNPVTSGGVYAADAQLQAAIEAILLLIPSAASALNQLADKQFVNSSIATNTATFRGTYNSVVDLHLAVDATHAQIEAALDGLIAVADNNDYCYVQIPVSSTSFDIEKTERYKFNGTNWRFEYQLNNSGFTAAQWNAINSGITAALVGDINLIKSLIPSEATTLNQLADKAYVVAQIIAAIPAFKGQFETLADLQAVASPKAGDLGIVRTKDSDGYDVFMFYQYLSSTWNVYYTLSHHPQTKPATTGTTGDYPYNGMGRVVLPMNIKEIGGVTANYLEQSMMPTATGGNTIYVITHDYVLANDIDIPDNCILEFDGGSISGNHTIEGNDTRILAAPKIQIFSGVDIQGTWIVPDIYTEWMEMSYSGDSRIAMQSILRLQNASIHNNVFFPDKPLYFLPVNGDISPDSSYIQLCSNTTYHIINTINVLANSVDGYAVMFGSWLKNIEIYGGKLIGDVETHTFTPDARDGGMGIMFWGCNHAFIHDIECSKMTGDGILLEGNQGASPATGYTGGCDNIIIRNVVCDSNRRQGMSLSCASDNLLIEGSKFINTGSIYSYPPSAGIDFEPDLGEVQVMKNIVVRDCLFEGNLKGLYVYYPGTLKNFSVDNCDIKDYTIQNTDEKHFGTQGAVLVMCQDTDNVNIVNSKIEGLVRTIKLGNSQDIPQLNISNCEIKGLFSIYGESSEHNFDVYFNNCKMDITDKDFAPVVSGTQLSFFDLGTNGVWVYLNNCHIKSVKSLVRKSELGFYTKLEARNCEFDMPSVGIPSFTLFERCTINATPSFLSIQFGVRMEGNIFNISPSSYDPNDYSIFGFSGGEPQNEGVEVYVCNNQFNVNTWNGYVLSDYWMENSPNSKFIFINNNHNNSGNLTVLNSVKNNITKFGVITVINPDVTLVN